MQLYKSLPKCRLLDRDGYLHRTMRFAEAEISRTCCDCTVARTRVGTSLQRREEGEHHQQGTMLRHSGGAQTLCRKDLPCAAADGAEEDTGSHARAAQKLKVHSHKSKETNR